MASESIPPAEPAEPDHFFLGRLPDRLPDGGPRYQETPVDPTQVSIAEPWNAVTASFFIFIVLFWVIRLRGRFTSHLFITCCMPILLVGGIGGTLYHAFRTQRAYFLMDVIPISLLGAAGAIYLTLRLGKSLGLGRVLAVATGLLAFYLGMNMFVFRMIPFPNRNWPVNLSYFSLAFILMVPLVVVLIRTRFRYVSWIIAGLISFVIAWFCRLVDGTPWGDLPMGTHWLWHSFGAFTTLMLTEYFYRIGSVSFQSSPSAPGTSP